MKKIEAFIKRRRLDYVIESLNRIEGMTGVSVNEIRGFGRQRGARDGETMRDGQAGLLPKVRLEIFCRDDHVEKIVTEIEKAAHTGLRGDGKIYVLPVEQAMRISTGERGEIAV